MNGFRFEIIFCEVLSGFVAIILIALVFLNLNSIEISSILTWIPKDGLLSIAVLMVLASYLLGLVVDALGLTIGVAGLDELMPDSPPSKEGVKRFWSNASEHVFAYREKQWAYYSLYRNLLFMFPLLFIFSLNLLFDHPNWLYVLYFVVFALIELSLFLSMRVLAVLYSSIPDRILEQTV